MALGWTFGRLQMLVGLGLLVNCLSASCIYCRMEHPRLQEQEIGCILLKEWVNPDEPATPDEGIVSALQARRGRGPFQGFKGAPRCLGPLLFSINPCQ